MNSAAERQRRWKAAQKAAGRRRVEFWVTEKEAAILKDALDDHRAYEELVNRAEPYSLIDGMKNLDPAETPLTQLTK